MTPYPLGLYYAIRPNIIITYLAVGLENFKLPL
jgi:hypothetical protein